MKSLQRSSVFAVHSAVVRAGGSCWTVNLWLGQVNGCLHSPAHIRGLGTPQGKQGLEKRRSDLFCSDGLLRFTAPYLLVNVYKFPRVQTGPGQAASQRPEIVINSLLGASAKIKAWEPSGLLWDAGIVRGRCEGGSARAHSWSVGRAT